MEGDVDAPPARRHARYLTTRLEILTIFGLINTNMQS